MKKQVVPYQLKDLVENERRVMERSREDFEVEWSWLFDSLPMRHRAKLASKCGVNWLEVSFVDTHKKSWSTEKYLLRDVLQHPDDCRSSVEYQCAHAMRMVMQSKGVPAKSKSAFEAEVGDLMVDLLVKSGKLEGLCDRHFGGKDRVSEIKVVANVEAVLK